MLSTNTNSVFNATSKYVYREILGRLKKFKSCFKYIIKYVIFIRCIKFIWNLFNSAFFWIEDFIEINKRQQTHHTHTKYTIYIE